MKSFKNQKLLFAINETKKLIVKIKNDKEFNYSYSVWGKN